MKRLFLPLMILATAFVLCIGVGAADERFSDFNQIDNQEEVMMLADLNLFTGYEDGTFRPDRTITRAEMAKVIATIDTPKQISTTAARFVDVNATKWSWAQPYIEYCADRGIISGGTDGNFRPGDSITGRELAKMLLIVVGNRPEQFTGADWVASVDTAAKAAGIYNGFTRDKSLFVSRDDACLMINNALQCSYISGFDAQGKPIYVLDALLTPKSVLENRFGVVLVTGVIEANAVADLRVGAAGPLRGDMIHVSGYTRDFKVSAQVARESSILGRKMTIYAFFGNDYNRIFGVPCERSEEIYSTFTNFATVNTILQYNAMTTTDKTKYYVNLAAADLSSLEDQGDGATATVIDHEGDGGIEYILINRPVLPAPSDADAVR